MCEREVERVCVREREVERVREREREVERVRERERERGGERERVVESMCVCVCEVVREREVERVAMARRGSHLIINLLLECAVEDRQLLHLLLLGLHRVG